MSVPIGTKLRITRPEKYAATDSAGHDDTTARDGHYLTLENTFIGDLSGFLRNERHQGEFFERGECVDVEVFNGRYVGRFRLNSAGDLVRLPSDPKYVSGHVKESA